MMDRSCVWHYPLVTHVTVARKPKPADVLVFNEKYPHDDLGQDLDAAVDNLPSSCPYSFKDTGWKWLKIADTVTEARSKTETTFTRREVY